MVFFENLRNEYVSSYIYVECKNYSTEISNEELDQLAKRFNLSTSQVGLLFFLTFY